MLFTFLQVLMSSLFSREYLKKSGTVGGPRAFVAKVLENVRSASGFLIRRVKLRRRNDSEAGLIFAGAGQHVACL